MADIDAEDKNETKVLFGKHNVWAIGITSVIGGHYFGWNSGLYSGFGSYLIATVLIALAYCCLCFCASEISSALPFAGGSYGLARCTLGYFPGFIVGCSETFQYIVFVSYSVLMMGDIIFEVAGLGTHNSYEPLLWLAFLLPVLVTHIIGGNIFWRFNYIIAIVSLVILMIFLFGQLDKVNYKNFKFLNKSGDDHYFVGGVLSFVKYFPVVSNFYLGVESINLASDDIKEPKVNVPFGQISCFFTLCACSILVVMVTCALPPGLHELAHSRYPLDKGFRNIFATKSSVLNLLSLPAIFATVFSNTYCFGKLMSHLAESRLLPEVFKHVHSSGTPYIAILVGTAMSYAICLLAHFIPILEKTLMNVCILWSFLTHASQCIGFVKMRTRFQNLNRSFSSPLGVTGAYYALFIYIFGSISLIGFQDDNFLALIILVVVGIVLSLYYFGYAISRQTFSEQERKIMFVAHVINYNIAKVAGKTRAVKRRSSIASAPKVEMNPERNNVQQESKEASEKSNDNSSRRSTSDHHGYVSRPSSSSILRGPRRWRLWGQESSSKNDSSASYRVPEDSGHSLVVPLEASPYSQRVSSKGPDCSSRSLSRRTAKVFPAELYPHPDLDTDVIAALDAITDEANYIGQRKNSYVRRYTNPNGSTLPCVVLESVQSFHDNHNEACVERGIRVINTSDEAQDTKEDVGNGYGFVLSGNGCMDSDIGNAIDCDIVNFDDSKDKDEDIHSFLDAMEESSSHDCNDRHIDFVF